MHAVAYVTLPRYVDLAIPPDRRVLAVIGGTLVLYGSLMLSQAMESVTRAFYARGDLDLVLSSPASARRLFAVRIGAMAVSIMAMALFLAAPVINVLAWRGGAHWLAAYGVMAAMAMVFRWPFRRSPRSCCSPRDRPVWKRTRSVAQVIAAVVGASFVIGVPFFAIASIGTLSRMEVFTSDIVVTHVPGSDSVMWLPAYATTGNGPDLVIIMVAGIILLAGAIRFCAPRFGTLALATAAISEGRPATAPAPAGAQNRLSPGVAGTGDAPQGMGLGFAATPG